MITVGHTIFAFQDGGMEQGLVNIITHGSHASFRHIILCLTRAGSFAHASIPKTAELVELHKREGNDFLLSGRIAAVAQHFKIDILHARGWPALVESAIAARLAGIAGTIYGFHGKTLGDLSVTSLKRRWIQRIMIRDYQRIVTLNRSMQTDLASECNLPLERIGVISNGVDVERFRPFQDQQKFRNKYGLPIERFIVGNVARLDPIKNHEVILRALRHLREQGFDPLFLLVGDGPHRTELGREIDRLGLRSSVRLLGYSDQIPEVLNCMDLYIQSSFYEGFSNAILEAMACGLPILATNVGGTTDLFSEGKQGFFFKPKDDESLAHLINRLYRHTLVRRRMGVDARQHVIRNFSLREMVSGYEDLYLELGSRSKGRRE